jgi:hypothetical protein
VGFQGAPRSVLVLGRDPDDDDRRVLVQTKSNYGREAPSLSFAIEPILLPATDGLPDIETSRIVELGESEHDAEAVLGARGDAGERGKLDTADDFLRSELAGGPVDVQTIKQLAKAAVIGWRAIETAKARLGIVSRRVGGAGADGRWTWEISNPARLTPQTPLLRSCGLGETPHETGEHGGRNNLSPQGLGNGGLTNERPPLDLGTATFAELQALADEDSA